MLTCSDAARLIVRRADGGPMAAHEDAALDGHVGRCAACRDALAGQRAVAAVLHRRPADAVSPSFAARLSRRLDEDAGWMGLADWRAWTFRLAPAAAALALAAYLTSGQTQSQALDLAEWTRGADNATAAAVLWDTDTSSDAVLERMLGGEEDAGSGGASDGR